MAIKLTSTNEAADFVKCVVYGPSGVGKTNLVKTAPKPLIISSEKRLLTLKKEKIPVVIIGDHEDLKEAFTFVTTNPKAKKFQTIVLDSISDIAETILAYFKANPEHGNAHPQAAYGSLADHLLPLIKDFRDIQDKHVYFIAKAIRKDDEYSGVSTWMPMLPGKVLGNQLPYLFDFVMAMRIGERKVGEVMKKYRFLQTQPDMQYIAKECSGNLNAIERPNLTYIFNKALGLKGEEKKKEVKEEVENTQK